MIVGVDETGDFGDGTRVVFVAAFVRPSTLIHLEAALRNWESRTRKRLRLANEVKGHALDDQAINEFVAEVLPAGGELGVRYLSFAVDVDEAAFTAMAVQRETLATGYDGWADQQGSADRQRQRFEKQLRHWATWIRSRTDRQMLKLSTLGTILPTLLEFSFGLSIANNFDDELVNLHFYLDDGYVKASEIAFWRDILRNIFIDRTIEHPIPFSDQWGPEHPVLQAFVEGEAGSGFLMKADFKTRITFCDSTNTPIVRVADVLASMIRRDCPDDLLRHRCIRNYPYTLLTWTEEIKPRPNPYLDIEMPPE